jgi:hypothetical protein
MQVDTKHTKAKKYSTSILLKAIFFLIMLCAGCGSIPSKQSSQPSVQPALPDECDEFNRSIPPHMYRLLNFEDSPCKLVTLSPDGSMLAYVTLETIGFNLDEQGMPSFETVKVVRNGYKSAEIYQKTLYTIVSLDWSHNGKLVILDAPIEGGLAWTVIYDPDAGGITQRFRGFISENCWNQSKTAFYLIMHPVHHGPACEGYFSGYDFEGRNPLPDINQELNYSGKIYFEPSHFWTEDGKALLLNIRKLTWDYDKSDYILGPAMLIKVNMIDDDPPVEILQADPSLDYILHNTEDGSYEIIEGEYEARYCYDF